MPQQKMSARALIFLLGMKILSIMPWQDNGLSPNLSRL